MTRELVRNEENNESNTTTKSNRKISKRKKYGICGGKQINEKHQQENDKLSEKKVKMSGNDSFRVKINEMGKECVRAGIYGL